MSEISRKASFDYLRLRFGDLLSIEFLLVLALFPQLYGDLIPFRANLLVYLGLGVSIIYFYFSRDNIQFSQGFFVVLIAYLLIISYAVLSLTWGPNPNYSYSKLVRLITIILLLLFATAIISYNVDRFYRLIRCLLIISLITATGSLYAFYIGVSPDHLLPPDSHIGVGRVIGIGLPIAVYFALESKSVRTQALNWGFSLLILAGFLPTHSRGPFLAAIISVLVLFCIYFATRYEANITSSFTILSGFSTVSIILYSFGRGFATVQDNLALLTGELHSTAVSRQRQYHEAFQFWTESPVTGHGIGSYPILVHGPGHSHRDYPHNFLLEVMAELGIVGTVLILFILSYSILLFSRNFENSGGAYVAFPILIYSVINASVSFDLPNNRILFFSIALLSSIYCYKSSFELK